MERNRNIRSILAKYLLLLSILLLLPTYTFALECKKCQEDFNGTVCTDSECPETPVVDQQTEAARLFQGDTSISMEISSSTEETGLSLAASLPDPNEPIDVLTAYLEEMEKVKQSIKKRLFDEPINTGGATIEAWLEAAGNLLSFKEKYPESRHIFEGLGRIYKELWIHTQENTYLLKAADAFIQAEDMGIKYGIKYDEIVNASHYIDEVADILSILSDRQRLDKYFSRVLKLNPENYYAYLYYAKALSRLNDKRADKYYEKAISLRQQGDFQPVVDYAEHLLDREKDKEALDVIQLLTNPSEYDAFYPHFLKGLALERMGRLEEAEEEYNKYSKFRDIPKTSANENERNIPVDDVFFRPPSRYKIPHSTLQKDIIFSGAISDVMLMATSRATPACASNDWACKARYYMVWTINGEAEKSGAYGPGTLGMMRAVGWNIRTRVFNLRGQIISTGCSGTCYANATQYPLTDINSLYKRYYYVIDTGGYAGLAIGGYTAKSEQVFFDVLYGRVPDPIVPGCVYGGLSGSWCEGSCTGSGLWNSFPSSRSGQQFRAGRLKSYWDPLSGDSCYQFLPMSVPAGAFCNKSCWAEKGAICPVTRTLSGLCHNPWQGFYDYTGPVYGNFFWRFNQ